MTTESHDYERGQASRIFLKALPEGSPQRLRGASQAGTEFLEALRHAALEAGYSASMDVHDLRVGDPIRNRGVLVRADGGRIMIGGSPPGGAWKRLENVEYDTVTQGFVGTENDTYRHLAPGFPGARACALAATAAAIVKHIAELK